MSDLVQRSYEHCKHVAKTEAKNFYYSFTVLPPEKKAMMCAIYAFMRYSDDISDEAALSASRHEMLPRWRAALDRAFEGDYGDSLILPAFHDTVVRRDIPRALFHELIDGAEMDLTRTRYDTFEDLYQYCYRVASVVGLVCLHVWGFDGGDAAMEPAVACGIAFQLTNILRDVKEDAARGRIYLPREDLARFGYSEEELLRGVTDERFFQLMRFEIARARSYYDQALPLIPLIHADCRPTFVIMYRIYRGLLDRIEQAGCDVFARRARLSGAEKAAIVARAWLRTDQLLRS
jgi:phytoene synthase